MFFRNESAILNYGIADFLCKKIYTDYLKICWNTTDSNGEKMLKIAICDDEKYLEII